MFAMKPMWREEEVEDDEEEERKRNCIRHGWRRWWCRWWAHKMMAVDNSQTAKPEPPSIYLSIRKSSENMKDMTVTLPQYIWRTSQFIPHYMPINVLFWYGGSHLNASAPYTANPAYPKHTHSTTPLGTEFGENPNHLSRHFTWFTRPRPLTRTKKCS